MPAPLRLLLIEDSEDDAALLLRQLRRGGYDVTFERVDHAVGLTAALEKSEWDLVISDYSMPHFSGTDALRLLRDKSADVPFIFVSGTMGEETAVAALKNGAQDYLMKTNLKRLVPAVQRELQEAGERRHRKRLEQKVQQLERFEAIGRLAGGIAHDFNNAIGGILQWADIGLEEARPASRFRDRFEQIRDQAQWAAKLTSQLLAFARQQVLQPKRINVNELVEGAAALLRTLLGNSIEIDVRAAPDLRASIADPTQIEQVLMNLCLNARDAMPDGGRILIETQNAEVDEERCRFHENVRPGSYVLLSVADTGSGMDPATIEHIFEPFFTTKEVGKGTGLGLATVYGVVTQHAGFVEVASRLGEGTTFGVYLPAAKGAAESPKAVAGEQAPNGTETILLAEDNQGLRRAAQEMLKQLGYRVIPASNGKEAVRLFRENADQVDLVVLDVMMPALNGPEAFREIAALRPGVRAIFTTGFAGETASLTPAMQSRTPILQKPYRLTTLTQAVRSLLERKDPA